MWTIPFPFLLNHWTVSQTWLLIHVVTWMKSNIFLPHTRGSLYLYSLSSFSSRVNCNFCLISYLEKPISNYLNEHFILNLRVTKYDIWNFSSVKLHSVLQIQYYLYIANTIFSFATCNAGSLGIKTFCLGGKLLKIEYFQERQVIACSKGWWNTLSYREAC